MRALIPIIISNQDASTYFAKIIPKEIKKITILIVVDSAIQKTSADAANFLAEAQQSAESLRAILGRKRKTCEVIVEWGDIYNKIDRTARLKGIQKIYLLEQESKDFDAIFKELSKSKDYTVELVKRSS